MRHASDAENCIIYLRGRAEKRREEAERRDARSRREQRSALDEGGEESDEIPSNNGVLHPPEGKPAAGRSLHLDIITSCNLTELGVGAQQLTCRLRD